MAIKDLTIRKAMRVNLSAKADVTNAVGATGNRTFDTVNGLGRNDVGSIVKVTARQMWVQS